MNLLGTSYQFATHGAHRNRPAPEFCIQPFRKWKVIIADRDPVFCERIRESLAHDGRFLLVADCVNGAEVSETVVRHQADLLFLDIALENLSAVRQLKNVADPPHILFIVEPDRLGKSHTLKLHHIERVYDKERLSELLRGFEPERLDQKAKHKQYRLLSRLPRMRSAQRFALKGPDGVKVFDTAEIFSIESDGNHLYFHTRSGLQRVRGAFPDIVAKLWNRSFFQINARTIVNLRHVREFRFSPENGPVVMLSNGQTFTVVRRYVQDLTRRIDLLWSQKKI